MKQAVQTEGASAPSLSGSRCAPRIATNPIALVTMAEGSPKGTWILYYRGYLAADLSAAILAATARNLYGKGKVLLVQKRLAPFYYLYYAVCV